MGNTNSNKTSLALRGLDNVKELCNKFITDPYDNDKFRELVLVSNKTRQYILAEFASSVHIENTIKNHYPIFRYTKSNKFLKFFELLFNRTINWYQNKYDDFSYFVNLNKEHRKTITDQYQSILGLAKTCEKLSIMITNTETF
ncbi:MAG: hypothetical protein ACPG4Z_05090 [Chitinophagales bacterium]